jgi:hypothetical protein
MPSLSFVTPLPPFRDGLLDLPGTKILYTVALGRELRLQSAYPPGNGFSIWPPLVLFRGLPVMHEATAI